jgi:NADH-quinone oxidoreductase subunit M
MTMPNVLTQVIFLPLAGAALLLAVPRRFARAFFPAATLVSALTFGLSLRLFADFENGGKPFQFVEQMPWIPDYNITYYVGIDGISLSLILLTTLLVMVALSSSSGTIRERRKEFVISILVLETALIGTFAALDVFLFYVFWELVLVPMYLLIGIFGGPRRIYATLKFFLYTMSGSVLMLVGILTLYWLHWEQHGFFSTSLADLYRVRVPGELQLWLFAGFVLAFAIKIPMFPFHTWLPDAHVEAPTAGSVILAGVLLKMGGYGMIRYAIPMFPVAAQAFAPLLGWLGVAGIIYGACVAMAQEDLKKLVAYSSVSHMGFVVLGLSSLTSIGMEGAVFQMVAHGLSTGSLFLLVGMLYERRHTRMLTDFGGLGRITPRLAAAFLVMTLASIGLPGLCGFVGEFMILSGSFRGLALGHPSWMVGISVLGVVLGAAYMLMVYERIFFGEVASEENRRLKDLSWSEGLCLIGPIVAVIWLGIAPNTLLNPITPAIKKVSQIVESANRDIPAERGSR